MCPPTLRGSCWIFDYWIFQHEFPPPGDGGGGGEAETKSPPGSRPSPPLAPRDKISRSGSPHSDDDLGLSALRIAKNGPGMTSEIPGVYFEKSDPPEAACWAKGF